MLLQLYCWTWSALILAQVAQVALQEELEPEFLCSESNCYSVLWISKSFAKSRVACEEKKGHLMTVENSEHEDIIAKFMLQAYHNDTRVWIGMEPKMTCTDHQQPLRGFTWVTGESYDEHANWRNDEQKCDGFPLCVTVRKDGTWEETKCNAKPDGFLCQITNSLICPPLPSFYHIMYTHPALGMGHSAGTVFPPGTIAQIFTDPDITRLTCEEKGGGMLAWSMEAPGAWSCQIANGGCERECVETYGMAECKCPPGSDLKPNLRNCTTPCDPNPCSQHCVLVPSGFLCMCSEGYTLTADGKNCEDIDDCAAIPNICEHHCINTIGSFKCDCKPGFQMNSTCDAQGNCVTDCQDIDECEKETCEHDCENYPGGFRCICHDGFVIDRNNLRKCNQICNTSVCHAECDPKHKKCTCPNGYIVDQTEDGAYVCTDMDECIDSHCDQKCINTLGSYTCTYHEDYTIYYNEESIPPTGAPSTPSSTSRPEDLSSLQPTIMWGICFGILSMFIVLIAMLCHRMRRHYIHQHDLEYNYKNPDKDVVLKKIMMEPQWQL